MFKACQYWTDTGEGLYELSYLRNKEKEEVDFLLTKNKMPWLMVEAKYKNTNIQTKVVKKFNQYLGCPYVQIVYEDEVWHKINPNTLVCSAALALSRLP